MKRKIRLSIVLVAFSVAVFGGCAAYDDFAATFFEEDEETVKIGVFEPMSGAFARYGELERAGIELARELYPELDGKPVQLIFADNESLIKRASSAAQELVDRDVLIVLGSYDSTLSIAGGEVFQEAGVPAISITNTNPVVTDAFAVYCRVCPLTAEQGAAAAAYAADNLRADKVAVIKEKDNDPADALARNFADTFTAKTGNGAGAVLIAEYEKGQKDFAKQLEKIEAFDAEAVFCPGSWEMGAGVMTQAGFMGLKTEFLGTDAWRTTRMLNMYKSGEMPPMAFTTYFNESARMTEMSTVFIEAYEKKYGTDVAPDPAVALAFDAYLVALESIRTADPSTERSEILKALRETEAFAGASGEITFDDRGDPIKPITISSVMDGKFVSLDSVKLEKEKGN
ncbi:MAG: ABC transporter substrate-binding protein [Clostridiales Family XIII bacterium]|jgi:branched-chain amino acid transport system substrate-binding protein|nr:ABC transporter substrate-binding protein [Clostridiales Family XIII bacterium]